MSNSPVVAQGDDTLILFRLTPRGGKDAIDGQAILADGRAVLKARVRAVPEDGAANAALLRLVSQVCRVPPSTVSLIAGATSRLKTIRITRPYTEMKPVFAEVLSGHPGE